MAVNADRSSEGVNEKGKNSRRTGSSPKLSEGLGKTEEHEDGRNHHRSAADGVDVEGDFVAYRASQLDLLGRGRS
jgi:hypothetical protein